MEDDEQGTPRSGLGRRELIKLGAGVVVSALAAPKAVGQERGAQGSRPAVAPGSYRKPEDLRPHTAVGYKYTAKRHSGNGPMDDTTRKIVRFVTDYNDSKMTESVVRAVNRTMLDSIAALITGFEEEQVRIAARMSTYAQPVGLKATVLGYGISTTPELATFANGCMVRATDFNDNADGGHNSNLIAPVLAFGEAMHSSGAQVIVALTIGYELMAAPAGGESVAAAMVAGKLMGLDEDRLANAVGMALVPHVALNKGVGALSMWKGVRSAEAHKCGVWAALLARDGMTGPPQPFEGRGSLWARNGRGRELVLPVQARMCIEHNWFKRRPSEASSQGTLVLIPEMRSWTKLEDIDSIQYDMSFANWDEIADAPKFDPANRETADHSMPYILARALLDGDVYADSYTPAKFNDPAARALMAKMTFGPVLGWEGLGAARITIRKKNGEQRTWDTYNGARVLGDAEYPNLTDEEVTAKFARACAYAHIPDAQRDRVRTTWGNLRQVTDIGEAIQTLAKFGQPKPLSA